MASSSADEDLINAMTDALSVDDSPNKNTATSAPLRGGREGRRASDTNTLTSATSSWFTVGSAGLTALSSAISVGSSSGGGSGAKKPKVVGGGQGLLPPDAQARAAQAQAQDRSRSHAKASSQNQASSHTTVAGARNSPISASGEENSITENVPSARQLLAEQQQSQNDHHHQTVSADRDRPHDDFDDLCDEITAEIETGRPQQKTQQPQSDTVNDRRRAEGRKKNEELELEPETERTHGRHQPARTRSGSPVEAFCADDLPTALEAMEAEAAKQQELAEGPPIDTIDPDRIKIGKKVVAPVVTDTGTGKDDGEGAPPSVVSTNCADSGSTQASPVEIVGVLKDVGSGPGESTTKTGRERQKSLSESASTVAMSNLNDLEEFLAEAEEEYDAEQERKQMDQMAKSAAKSSQHRKSSTEAIADAEDLADNENVDDDDDDDADNEDVDDDDYDDDKSLELADAVARTSPASDDTPKRRGSGDQRTQSQKERSYPSVTRHQYSGKNGSVSSTKAAGQHNSQGSSLISLGHNSAQTFSSLKKQLSSSSSSDNNKSSSSLLLKRQTSSRSNQSSSRSVQFREDSSPQEKRKSKSGAKAKSKPALSHSSSFEATADLYRQKYAKCKNRSLWANLDKTIDTNVIAAPPRTALSASTPDESCDGEKAEVAAVRSTEQREKANQLLRRRVRMCFAALTVVFGDGIEEDPVEVNASSCSGAGAGHSADDRDLNDSFTSLNEDIVSIRSGMSAMTQRTARSTASNASKKSRRSRHRRRLSASSSSTADGKVDGINTPTKKRPSIPLAVARLLFVILIRRRGGLDDDEDYARAAEMDNASTDDSEKRAELAQARINFIVDDIIEVLVSTLGLVDLISNFGDDDEQTTSGSSSNTQREFTGRRRDRRGSLSTDCAAIASRVSSQASDEGACLFINHDVHMLYGQAMALYRPEVFFADTAAFNRYLYKNHTTMASWDPEVELNYEMADACLACIRQKHSSNPIGGPPGDVEYGYSLEAVPVHLLRCGRYHELNTLLSKDSYVRRKLRKLGSLNGVKAHIADIEDMNEMVARAGITTIDMNLAFVLSFKAMDKVLRTANEQAEIKAAKSQSQRSELRSLSFQIQTAESLYAMGASLQEHGFEEDALEAYMQAMEKFAPVHDLMTEGGGKQLPQSSRSDSDLYMPSMDHIQFVMAETLVGIARVFDGMGDLDGAMEYYERALSFYSKQRSLRHQSGVASTLTTMGVISFRKKQWDVAMACFDEALIILQSLEVDGNKGEEVGDIFQWQGNIKRETGDYERALALFTEAFYTITLKYGKQHPRVGRIHQSMAIIHDDLGNFTKSLEHYAMALKIRKRAVARSIKSDDIQAFEVATVEELAVAETLMCQGNVYRLLENFSKAYDCYLENALIMRLDVTALLGNAFLTTNGVLGLLIGDNNDEGSVGAVNILYNRLMMTLDMARRVELQSKEKLISGDYADGIDDSEARFLRSEQVAECLYDVGVISASRYLQKLDSDTSLRVDQLVQQREEALSCFEEVIVIRQERVEALSKLFGHGGAEEHGRADEQMIIAYSLYEVGRLLSCTFFALQQRDPTEKIDGDLVKRDISAALSAFSDAKDMFKGLNCSFPAEIEDQEPVIDPALARAKHVTEVLEEMTQTMAILYRETDQHDKALEMYTEQLNLHVNESNDSGDVRDDASYYSIESSKLSREEKVAQAIEDIGGVLRDQGDTQRALDHYTEALEVRASVDEAGLSVAKTLRLIGRLHLQRKEWDLAIGRFEEELKILINLLDENSSSIAYCFHSIGKAYEGKDDLAKALDYFKRARKTIGDAALAETDIQYTHVLFDTGNILLQMAKSSDIQDTDYELALRCLKTAFDGYKAFYGESSVEAANTLFLQGELFYSHEEYETGINCFEEALRVYRTTLGEDNIKVARTLNLIGLSHLESGSDEAYAMECFDACLAILQSKGHEGSEDHACVLFYKAAAHEKNEQLDLATVCYEGSVQYYRKLLGSDAMKIAVVLEKLGTCLLNDHEPEMAKGTLEEALRIRKKHRADKDLETSEIFYGLGIAYCEEKEFNKSLDAYEKCFLLRQELLGETDVEVAQVLNNVGSVFARAGEYERALAPWNDALAMYRDAGLKEDNERIVTTMSNIALSRNLISIHREGDSIIRTFLIY